MTETPAPKNNEPKKPKIVYQGDMLKIPETQASPEKKLKRKVVLSIGQATKIEARLPVRKLEKPILGQRRRYGV